MDSAYFHPASIALLTALGPAWVAAIRKLVHPVAVCLLGATVAHARQESIFARPAEGRQRLRQATLLVILPEGSGKEPYEWQDLIESHCGEKEFSVTALVFFSGRFRKWIADGHPFAHRVLQESLVLFDGGEWASFATGTCPSEDHNPDMRTGISRSQEFLAGAELYRLRRQAALSAFMLHQAAEQCLCTMVRAGLHFRPNTHNIDRLLRYAALAYPALDEIFPRHAEGERRLLQLLQKAYVDTRYGDYHIPDRDLAILAGRVGQLIHLLQSIQDRLPEMQPAL